MFLLPTWLKMVYHHVCVLSSRRKKGGKKEQVSSLKTLSSGVSVLEMECNCCLMYYLSPESSNKMLAAICLAMPATEVP